MKKKATSKRVNVGVSALARETGQSPSSVSQKLKEGQTAEKIRADAARKQGRAPTATKKAPGRPKVPSEYDMVIASRSRYDAMEEAKLRRQRALAERQEIENMLRNGELMPIAYARKWGLRFLIDGRDEMLKGPSELADELAAEADPVRVKAILLAWVERVMAKFEQLEMLWKGEVEHEQVA
jgi:hypothetical protein